MQIAMTITTRTRNCVLRAAVDPPRRERIPRKLSMLTADVSSVIGPPRGLGIVILIRVRVGEW